MNRDIENKIITIMIIILSICSLVVIATPKSTENNLMVVPEKNPELVRVTVHTPLFSSAPWERIPSQVNVLIEECNGDLGICYPDIQNITMKNRGSGNYQKRNITLNHADATYITCTIILFRYGVWEKYMERRMDL